MKSNLTKDELNEIGFYTLHNPNTQATYIGSGILGDRQYEHELNLKKGKHPNYKLQRAYRQDEHFEFTGVVVRESDDVETNRKLALAIEQDLLDEFIESPDVLNLAREATAPMAGRKHTEDSLRKMSESRKGIPLSSEHKAKIAEKAKLRFQDPAVTEQLAQARRNTPASEATKERISTSIKAKYQEGYTNPNLGKTLDDEHKKKIGEANRGHQHTEDARKKISEAVSKPVRIEGVVYKSAAEAASVLNINYNTVYTRLRSSNYPSWEQL